MLLNLEICSEEYDNKWIMRLNGRIDVESAPLLERKMALAWEENKRKILVDFQRVEYLNTAGIRVLFFAAKKMRASDGDLICFGMRKELAQVIIGSGFERIFPNYATERDAISALALNSQTDGVESA